MSNEITFPIAIGAIFDIPIGDPVAYYVRITLCADGTYSVTIGGNIWSETYSADQIVILIAQLQHEYSAAPPPELHWRMPGLGIKGKFVEKTP